MPRRDGTGPMGSGSMTGRGSGLCTRANAVRRGSGAGKGLELGSKLGFTRGFCGNFNVDQNSTKTRKELLKEQKDSLEEQIEIVKKQLEE